MRPTAASSRASPRSRRSSTRARRSSGSSCSRARSDRCSSFPRRPAGSGFRRPSPALLGLAALAFAGLLAEGAAADWSGVYLDESVGTGKAAATTGFAAFAATMTIGRLVGDRLTEAWRPVALTRRAGLLAAAGMTLALGVGDAVSGVVGFACLGIGLAIGFLAEGIGLRAALGVLVGLGLLIAALAGSTRAA